MIIRIWQAGISAGRHKDLEEFANLRSLPMFQQHEGCLGVFFGRNADTCTTITLWDSFSSIDKLNRSPLYLETVSQIEASGILTGDSRTESFECFEGFLRQEFSSGFHERA